MKTILKIIFLSALCLSLFGTVSVGQTVDVDFNPNDRSVTQFNLFAAQSLEGGNVLLGGFNIAIKGALCSGLVIVDSQGRLVKDLTIDGGVFCLERQTDGKIVVGGNFSSILGQKRNSVARLNRDGSLDTSFSVNIPQSSVRCVLLYPNGGILIGGGVFFNDSPRKTGLIRLDNLGKIDGGFAGEIVGDVYTLARLSMDRIVVGGDFSFVNGKQRKNLVRLLSNGLTDESFSVEATNVPAFFGGTNVVRTILAQGDDAVVVGGFFNNIGGRSRNNLARIAADGSVDVNFPASDDGISRIVKHPDGSLLVSGNFGNISGVPLNSLARLSTGGELDQAFNARLNGALYGVYVLAEGKFIIGGRFSEVSGSTRYQVALMSYSPPAVRENQGRLVNLSILTKLEAGGVLTLGTVLGGSATRGSKRLLLRGVGPSLGQLGVPDFMPDPKMDVFRGQSVVASNDNWGGGSDMVTGFSSVGAFAFASVSTRDAAIFQENMEVGNYTVQISSSGASMGGMVLAEVYDATPSAAFTDSTPRLVNVSVLKDMSVGETLTAGFVVGGGSSRRVLIRAVGPALALHPFNIAGAMADPRLVLYSDQQVIGSNDDWGRQTAGTAVTQITSVSENVGAFRIADTFSRDSTLLVTLSPGNYTAQVSSANGGFGYVIVEVYEVP